MKVLVLAYSIVLFLKTWGLVVFAKIVFLNKKINICWFNYELRGFNDFSLGNIVIGQYHIYRKQIFKKSFFSKNKAFLYHKNSCLQRRSKVILRFSTLK